jgi:antitoxin ParD1/3/4
MNVSLTKELEKFVQDQVDGGLYQTASEVVRAGLRRLKEDRPDGRWRPRTYKELEEGLLASVERLERGEGVSLERSRRSLQRRIKVLKGRVVER